MRPVHHLLALHLHAIHNLRWPADSEQVMEQGDTGGKEQTLPPPSIPKQILKGKLKKRGTQNWQGWGGGSTSSELGNRQWNVYISSGQTKKEQTLNGLYLG